MLNDIRPIRALKDNYIWLLSDESQQQAWVVDPGDAKPVITELKKNGLTLAGILVTHHHLDHSGGIAELLQFAGKIPVYGANNSPLSSITHRLNDNDEIACGKYQFKIIAIPGHTLDHIAYYGENSLFCGDTLFSGGCGRVFEGTYLQMFSSLKKLSALNDATNIYCGHEYTLANLYFAQHVEPNNKWIMEKIIWAKESSCTLPSTLGEEKLINPFLRCEILEIIQAAEKFANQTLAQPVEVFTCLREWKNKFT